MKKTYRILRNSLLYHQAYESLKGRIFVACRVNFKLPRKAMQVAHTSLINYMHE